MPPIDFREIPQANVPTGGQDDFEMFARDFLSALGYVIVEGPGRGADEAKDLVVVEKLSGILTDDEKRWLVSCKHYAHSGRAVSRDDEVDVKDRVTEHRCDGFIAFYSTLPSGPLNSKFKRLKEQISIEVLDRRKIERLLVTDDSLRQVFARYFPGSYSRRKQKEVRCEYRKRVADLESQLETKLEAASGKRNATAALDAQREFERQKQLAETKRDIELASLGE